MIVWRARPPLDGTAAAAAAAAAVPPSEWPSVRAAPWVPRSLHGDTNTDEMFIYTTILYLTWFSFPPTPTRDHHIGLVITVRPAIAA